MRGGKGDEGVLVGDFWSRNDGHSDIQTNQMIKLSTSMGRILGILQQKYKNTNYA